MIDCISALRCIRSHPQIWWQNKHTLVTLSVGARHGGSQPGRTAPAPTRVRAAGSLAPAGASRMVSGEVSHHPACRQLRLVLAAAGQVSKACVAFGKPASVRV